MAKTTFAIGIFNRWLSYFCQSSRNQVFPFASTVLEFSKQCNLLPKKSIKMEAACEENAEPYIIN